MKNKTRFSTIALFAALAATPAAALSLNLGGDGPLVDLSNDSNANATVSVDTGNVLGGDAGGSSGAGSGTTINLDLDGSSSSGALLDLGGDDDDALIDLSGDDDVDAVVDLDLGSTGSIGGGTGDAGHRTPGGLLDLGGGDGILLDLGDGPLLDLSGDDDIDGAIEVDLGSTGSIGGTGDGLLDLGGQNANVFSRGTDATLDLGDTDVLADVNASGDDGPIARVDLLSGRRGAANTGVLAGQTGLATIGGDTLATISLTGDDASAGGDDTGGGGSDTGGGTNTGSGNTGGGSTGGGDTGGGTDSGGGNTGGTNTSGGTNTGANDDDDDIVTGGIAPADRTMRTPQPIPPRVAAPTTTARAGGSAGASASAGACLNLTGEDITQLIERHAYDWPTFQSWADADAMRVVEVDLCDEISGNVDLAVEASSNVAQLQAFLAGQAKVREGLQQTGHTPDDVIAADPDGDVLVVYVTEADLPQN